MATDFGDLTGAYSNSASSDSSTRGVSIGGYVSPANVSSMEFITMASQGNSVDYGDATNALDGAGGTSNSVRGI